MGSPCHDGGGQVDGGGRDKRQAAAISRVILLVRVLVLVLVVLRIRVLVLVLVLVRVVLLVLVVLFVGSSSAQHKPRGGTHSHTGSRRTRNG